MALKLRNRKFYPYAFLVAVSTALVAWYLWIGRGHGDLLLGALTAIGGFFGFLYKQHLDQTRLFKELFVDFNRRYDRLNNDLNKIVGIHTQAELTPDERNTVFDYFNLCAEEHFFNEAHYIDQKVWNAWRHGMAFFFNDSRIRELWNQECRSPDEHASYYGFEPSLYEARTSRPATSTVVEPTQVSLPEELTLTSERLHPPQTSATWQAEAQRAGSMEVGFSVRSHFVHAPRLSVEWSQQFVEAALSYDGVKAFVNGPGIGFDPNFVFIERVYTEDNGFIASFYGSVEQFRRYSLELEPGRTPASYSRLRVKSPELLQRALKCLHVSANLRDLDRA
jgi:hypothetical protein